MVDVVCKLLRTKHYHHHPSTSHFQTRLSTHPSNFNSPTMHPLNPTKSHPYIQPPFLSDSVSPDLLGDSSSRRSHHISNRQLPPLPRTVPAHSLWTHNSRPP